MHTLKLYSCSILIMLFFISVWGQQIQPSNENYVMKVSAQKEFKTVAEFENAPLDEKIANITYYDGLGRPKQEVAVGASPTTSSSTNLVSMDWSPGQGSTSFFNQNGQTSENSRELGVDPTGQSSLLWKCGNDAQNDADGGWNTNYFNIDNTTGYRYSVWVKRTGSQDGKTFHGTQNVDDLKGVAQDNPYFWNGDLPLLNTWYLIVGIIHPHDYTGEDTGISGVYDIDGNRVLDGKEFKWRKDVHISSFRSYLYYSTDTNVRQYFWNPVIQRLDGTEFDITDVSVFSTTNELTMDWISGTGGTSFFNQNGQTSENKREYGNNPNGLFTILWKCGNDAANDADGGWNTDYFAIDNTLEYRYTVWVKRTGSHDGYTHHGTNNVEDLNGVAQSNPYFWYGDLPELDTWYLLKGVIHPKGYTGGDKGISGVYDINGKKVLDGKEFRWSATSTNSRLRNYFYYSTNTNTHQYFWNPVVRKLGGAINPDALPAQENTTSPRDIVTHIAYDEYGRQAKQYLPVTIAGTTGSHRDININYHINGYYLNSYQDDFPGIVNPAEVNAYSESVFDPSPLNRITEQGAPGTAWKVNASGAHSHTIKYEWKTNQLKEVKYYYVTFENNNPQKPQLAEQGHYAIDQLYVTTTKDENWSYAIRNNHTTKEYKDKMGRVILKRTFNNYDHVATPGAPPNGDGGDSTENAHNGHNTYYVYDDYGNLTYVLPPGIQTTSQEELDKGAYQYRYDYRNRLIEKKIPGKGWESIVYNKLDQPIMTQDAILKTNGVWLFTKYDAFGRVAYTGKITDNRDRSTIQNEVNEYQEKLWVEKGAAIAVTGTTMHYAHDGYPNTQNAEVLTIAYYDDYNFDIAGFVNPGTVSGEALTNRTRSLPTGAKVRILGTDDWITTVNYYDKKGRAIYVGSRNTYLNTTDIVTTQLDFMGRVLQTKATHTKGNNSSIITIDTFSYDHVGRLLTQTQKINDQVEELLVNNQYDELGQLINKQVGGAINSGGLQQVDYKYNIRGWLKGINDVNNLGNDLFAFGINYNDPTQNQNSNTFDPYRRLDKLYNGNISETIWITANDNTQRNYRYQYDFLNRIIKATSSDGNHDLVGVTYDKRGNILGLARKGHLDDNATTFGNMDQLRYRYDGNQLLRVTDTGNQLYGFKDGTNTDDDYVYDTNSNLIKDQNKGITSISYNHLNLPETVTISNDIGTGTISYIYDATGVNQKKIATEGSSVTTEYAGNYVYKNGNLEFFNHTEGIIEKEADGYKYVYQFKDHLDNIRLSYKDDNKDGTITQNEIIQEKNYYPFGLTHKGYNNILRGRNHIYGYNGKEENDELNFNTLDYGARFYDPALGRWFTPDALAEKYYSDSTYGYALNNPILYIDPDGNQVAMCCEKLQGFVAGMVDNTFGTNIRSKGSTAEFREGVMQANGTSLAIATILLIDGTVSTTAGTGGLVASGAAASTGVGAPVGGIGAAASGGLLAKGAAELTIGGVMMANTISNMNNDANSGNGDSSTQSNISKKTGKGRGSNNRTRADDATGDHTVINENGSTTYKVNQKNPNKNSKGYGFETVKRVDYKGAAHVDKKTGVKTPTPHVQEKGTVRSAVPGEDMPWNYNKN